MNSSQRYVKVEMSFKALYTNVPLVGALLLLSVVPARPELSNCTDKLLGDKYAIYFDAFTNAGTGGQLNRDLAAQFESTIRSYFESLNAELQSEDARLVELVPCNKERSPTDADVFTTDEIGILDTHRVILEVWGNLNPQKGTGLMGYVLVPHGKTVTPVVFVHGRTLMAPTGSTRKPIFRENPELMAYTHIVIGIRSFNNQDFDEASSHLCKGKILLQSAINPIKNSTETSERLFVSRQQQLIGEIQALATEAVTRTNPNSGTRAALTAPTASFQCPN